jgi:hypothetical protein
MHPRPGTKKARRRRAFLRCKGAGYLRVFVPHTPLQYGAHKNSEATSPAIENLAPIVRWNTRRRPGIVRAKGIHIFRPKDSPIFRIPVFRGRGMSNPFARVRFLAYVLFVVSGDVLGRHGRICHRSNNQSGAEQAKKRLSHYLSPSISLVCRDACKHPSRNYEDML